MRQRWQTKAQARRREHTHTQSHGGRRREAWTTWRWPWGAAVTEGPAASGQAPEGGSTDCTSPYPRGLAAGLPHGGLLGTAVAFFHVPHTSTMSRRFPAYYADCSKWLTAVVNTSKMF